MRAFLTFVASIILVCGAASSAFASTCDVKPSAPISPIAAQDWIDQAEFAFQMGHVRNSGMVIQKRFAKFKSRTLFKSLARKWTDTYSEGRRLSNLLIQMESDVATLVNICKRLDAAAFDGTPFDHARATRELVDIRSRINPLAAALHNYETSLRRYSDIANAGVQYYQRQNFSANPDLFIGPSPARVSNQLQTLSGNWRVIAADFRKQTYLNVTVAVNPEKETDIRNMATQAQILANIIKRAQSVNANLIPNSQIQHYASGAYLYERCPIEEGGVYRIDNVFFKGRFLLDDQNRVKTLSESSMQWRIQSPVLEPGRRWTFKKAGAGFWKIQSMRSAGSDRIFDNAGIRDFTMKSPPSKRGLYSGQAWRCYNTRWPNAYRFSNSTWSEDRSIDGSAGETMAMSPTGAFGGQLWLISPY